MKLLIALLCSTLFISCGEKRKKLVKKNGEISSTIVDKGVTKEIESKELSLTAMNLTTMEFDRDTIDFGNVTADTDNIAKFTVYNTGNKPLKIEKVSASCGCTTVKEPENEIPVGGSDQIEVNFHPKIDQLNEQEKTVTVKANINPQMKVVKLKAFVLPKK
ncbi:MAG: DUF1573 domain-containing protein [Crocinitomicaceae bacterium]|nr:DUF1573 domain-containing protein [Crocinitomicaceae bacterium]